MSDSPRPARDRRGQTPLDFAIAAGIFVVAVLFVVAFVPSLTAPFERGAGERTVAADRVATTITDGLLGSPKTPSSFDADCTVGFFDGADVDGCEYDGGDLTAALGLPDYRNVRVELFADLDGDGTDETLCWDTNAQEVVTDANADCDVTFRTGDGGTSSSTAVSRRSVAVERVGATMTVRVW